MSTKLAEVDYNKYLRVSKLPTTWCAGCGDGAIMKALIRALDEVQLDRQNTAIVSGIGCSGRFSGYLRLQHAARHPRPSAGLRHRPENGQPRRQYHCGCG